ncbi:MAG: hypothetical protein WBD20_18395 [Pirellulaceae bacterium]
MSKLTASIESLRYWPTDVINVTLRTTAFVLLSLLSQTAHSQLSFDVPPINYSTTEPNDPVAKLKSEVANGDVVIDRDDTFGYLQALLKELDIPLSSQTLVFSKTSLQRHIISPSNPRAVFFNDHTYVAWVPHGEVIEISSTDPMLGTVFYSVEQYSPRQPVHIARRTERCLFCHASSDTGRVPGLMMQSIFTDADGNRVLPSDSIWPKSDGPLQTRFSGWFVTGKHGKQSHLGNLMIDSNDTITGDKDLGNGNIVDLSKWFDVANYPTPHSDIVALLVLQHQVSMHNCLTDTNHRIRRLQHQAAIDNRENDRDESFLDEENRVVVDQIAEDLTDELLMVGGVTFSEPVSGTSDFASEFPQRGPKDAAGRSLRDFDLTQGLFRYPCSYLVYSESFDALPDVVRQRIGFRLKNVLTNDDTREKYNHLSAPTRTAILEILRHTKPNLVD